MHQDVLLFIEPICDLGSFRSSYQFLVLTNDNKDLYMICKIDHIAKKTDTLFDGFDINKEDVIPGGGTVEEGSDVVDCLYLASQAR